MPTREQVVNALETLATFSAVGIGLALGMTTFGEVLVSGIGLSLATDIIKEGGRQVKERWIKRGVVNHHIQRALGRSFVRALDALWQDYHRLVEAESLRQGKRFLTRGEERAVRSFVDDLKKDAEAVFVRTLGRQEGGAAGKEILAFLYEPPSLAVGAFWAQVEARGGTADLHETFQTYLRERLLDAVVFWFGEELKSDTREGLGAWRAFQRLLLEGLREEVQSVRAGQDAIRADLRKLDVVAAQLDRLEAHAERRLPDAEEPFREGLNRALEQVGRNLEAVRLRLDTIDQSLLKIQEHLGIGRRKLCFVTGPYGSERLRILTDEVVKPVLAEQTFAYDVEVSDLRVGFGDLEMLEKADLVIADLTGSDPSVVYELAVRHCLGRPDIVLREEDEDWTSADLPFQTHRIYHIDLEDVEAARALLRKAVREVEEAVRQRNPVTDFFKAPLTEVSPAYGLALGYCWNFVLPVARVLLEVRRGDDAYVKVGGMQVEDRARLEAARLAIVVPDRLGHATRGWIEEQIVRKHELLEVTVGNPRVSFSRIYTEPAGSGPLVLLDVPTTLNVVIEAIRHRLGLRARQDSNEWLIFEGREIAHFVNSLRTILQGFDRDLDYLDAGVVEIVPLHRQFTGLAF